MRKHLVLLTVFAASLALASKASAQNPRQAMKQIDTNGDRMLQFSEIQNFRASAFDRLDINASGILEASEIASMQQQTAGRRRGGSADLDPYAADQNRDGFISRDEFVSYIAPRLLSADRNGDGALSRSELRALR